MSSSSNTLDKSPFRRQLRQEMHFTDSQSSQRINGKTLSDSDKHELTHHPHGYQPYKGTELPQVHYRPPPLLKTPKRGQLPRNALLIGLVATVVVFLALVLAGIVCCYKLLHSQWGWEKGERQPILGEDVGARPKTNIGMSSSRERGSGGGSSRPPSYRALAPPNYAQAQEHRLAGGEDPPHSPQAPPSLLASHSPGNFGETLAGKVQAEERRTDKLLTDDAMLWNRDANERSAKQQEANDRIGNGISGFNEPLSCTPVIFGDTINYPASFSSSTDDSFTSNDDVDAVSTQSEKSTKSDIRDVARRSNSGKKNIHEPIYEEVFEEEFGDEKPLLETIGKYSASAPTYENFRSPRAIAACDGSNVRAVAENNSSKEAVEGTTCNDDRSAKDIKQEPAQAIQIFLDNQARMNDLMDELTRQMGRQKNKSTLLNEDESRLKVPIQQKSQEDSKADTAGGDP